MRNSKILKYLFKKVEQVFANDYLIFLVYTCIIMFCSIIFLLWFCVTYMYICFKYIMTWSIDSEMMPDPDEIMIEYFISLVLFLCWPIAWLASIVICVAGAVDIIERFIIYKSSRQEEFATRQKHLVFSKINMVYHVVFILFLVLLFFPYITLNVIKCFILFLFFPLVFSVIFSFKPLSILIFFVPILTMTLSFSLWPQLMIFNIFKLWIYAITVPILFYVIFGDSDTYKEFQVAWSTTDNKAIIGFNITMIYYIMFLLIVMPLSLSPNLNFNLYYATTSSIPSSNSKPLAIHYLNYSVPNSTWS